MCLFLLSTSISDYSEVHNIDDSDDEPFVQEGNPPNVRQMPPTHSAKIDIKLPIKPRYDSEHTFDEDVKYQAKHAMARISSQYRSHLKRELGKQSASKLHRYLAVKRSIKWYVYVLYFVIIPRLICRISWKFQHKPLV